MEDREEQDALALLSAWFGEDADATGDEPVREDRAVGPTDRRRAAIAVAVGILAALLLTSRCSSAAGPAGPAAPPRADGVLAAAEAGYGADVAPGALLDGAAAGGNPADPAGPDPSPLPEEVAASARTAALGVAAREGLAAGEAVVEGHRRIGGIVVVVVRVGVDPGVVRYAVPLSEGPPAPVVLEVPWRLPAPAMAAGGPAWTPVIDAALAHAVASALEGAGYRGVRALALSASPTVPGVLRVALDATAPGDSLERRHHVWVSASAPFRIAGVFERAPAEPVPPPGQGGTP